MVTVEDTISGTTYSVEGEQYNEEAFNLWREANVRQEDRVLFIQDADGCDPILDNPAELYNQLRTEAPKEPILAPNKRRKGKVLRRPERAEFKPMEAEIIEVEPAEPIRQTKGLLSEYGITWGLMREPKNKQHPYHAAPAKFF
ncbi:hypothetical protein HY58_13405 [Flavihumibacter sp. ZG627]|nr:hypothetical protein HY58_13405 [Flavihumibacter sp. ZG627]